MTMRSSCIYFVLAVASSLAFSNDASAQFGGGDSPATYNVFVSGNGKIKSALAVPLKAQGLDFTEEPLENVVAFLRDEYELPIHLDEKELENVGITRDVPVTIQVTSVPLSSAIRLMLKPLQLAYVIRDGYLLITTSDVAAHELHAVVYNVRDLVGDDINRQEINALIDALDSCVAPNTWTGDRGGYGEIKPLRGGILVISQTDEVLEKIDQLLASIRETQAQLRAAENGGGQQVGWLEVPPSKPVEKTQPLRPDSAPDPFGKVTAPDPTPSDEDVFAQ